MSTESRSINCAVSGLRRSRTPEEIVRQSCARALIDVLGYDPRDLAVQFPVKVGSRTVWIDIAIFPSGRPHAQDQIYGVVECKRPRISRAARAEGIQQMQSYAAVCDNAHFAMFVSSADGSDRETFEVTRRAGFGYQYRPIDNLPAATETLRTRFTLAGEMTGGVVPKLTWNSVGEPAPDRPVPIVAIAGGVVALSGVGLAMILATSDGGRDSTVGSESRAAMSFAPVGTPSVQPRSAPGFAGCVVAADGAFHLRPTETLQSVGREFPSGTRVEVLGAGSLYRNGFLIYRVRVQHDGSEGYLFLGPQELRACGPSR